MGCYSFIILFTHIKGFLVLMVCMLARDSRNSLPSGPSIPQRARQRNNRGQKKGGHCLGGVTPGISVPHATSILLLPFQGLVLLLMKLNQACISSQEFAMPEPHIGGRVSPRPAQTSAGGASKEQAPLRPAPCDYLSAVFASPHTPHYIY